jgi:hypothetical protein
MRVADISGRFYRVFLSIIILYVSYFLTDNVVIHLTLSEQGALADSLEVAHSIC